MSNLRALGLEGALHGEGMQVVLQQVAVMSTLRSLLLKGKVVHDHHLSSKLELCTQLTALDLRVWMTQPGPGANTMIDRDYVPVPQQLTGLRSLVLPGNIFEHGNGACLAPLSHLTSLCLRVGRDIVGYALVEGPVCQVRDWPALWQNIIRAGRAAEGAVTPPTHWLIPPAAPGSASINVFVEEEGWQGHGWSQPLVPCPHLPCVWELQGEAQGSACSRSRVL